MSRQDEKRYKALTFPQWSRLTGQLPVLPHTDGCTPSLDLQTGRVQWFASSEGEVRLDPYPKNLALAGIDTAAMLSGMSSAFFANAGSDACEEGLPTIEARGSTLFTHTEGASVPLSFSYGEKFDRRSNIVWTVPHRRVYPRKLQALLARKGLSRQESVAVGMKATYYIFVAVIPCFIGAKNSKERDNVAALLERASIYVLELTMLLPDLSEEELFATPQGKRTLALKTLLGHARTDKTGVLVQIISLGKIKDGLYDFFFLEALLSEEFIAVLDLGYLNKVGEFLMKKLSSDARAMVDGLNTVLEALPLFENALKVTHRMQSVNRIKRGLRQVEKYKSLHDAGGLLSRLAVLCQVKQISKPVDFSDYIEVNTLRFKDALISAYTSLIPLHEQKALNEPRYIDPLYWVSVQRLKAHEPRWSSIFMQQQHLTAKEKISEVTIKHFMGIMNHLKVVAEECSSTLNDLNAKEGSAQERVHVLESAHSHATEAMSDLGGELINNIYAAFDESIKMAVEAVSSIATERAPLVGNLAELNSEISKLELRLKALRKSGDEIGADLASVNAAVARESSVIASYVFDLKGALSAHLGGVFRRKKAKQGRSAQVMQQAELTEAMDRCESFLKFTDDFFGVIGIPDSAKQDILAVMSNTCRIYQCLGESDRELVMIEEAEFFMKKNALRLHSGEGAVAAHASLSVVAKRIMDRLSVRKCMLLKLSQQSRTHLEQESDGARLTM